MSESVDTFQFKLAESKIVRATVLAGVLLTLLLPAGWLFSINGILFQGLFSAHLLCHLVALGASLVSIWNTFGSARYCRNVLRITFVLLSLMIAINAALPVTMRDALIHHLAAPKWWVNSGKIHQIPWHEWSYFPMLLNLAFTGFLSWGSESAAALYHFSYLIIIAGLTAEFVNRSSSRERAELAPFAAILALSIPIAIKLAVSPMVDLGLALYTAIAMLGVTEWVESKGEGRWPLILGGMALGLSLGTKYNGLLAALVLALVTLIYAARSKIPTGKMLSGAAIFGFFALAIYSPWMVRNGLATGNPIYPMYNGYFGIREVQNAVSSPTPIQLRRDLYGEGGLQFVLLPLRMILFGEDDNPRAFDGVLTPILLFLFVPFVRWSSGKWRVLFCGFPAMYFIFALFLSGARTRYLIPLLFPVIILTIDGIERLSRNLNARHKSILIKLLLVCQITIGGCYLARLSQENEALSYLFGAETREQYLQRRSPFYSVVAELNNTLPTDAVVYLVYTPNLFYYFDIGVRGTFDAGLKILSWANAAQSYDEFSSNFDQLAVTHLLIHSRRLSDYFAQFHVVLPSEKREYWNRFYRERLQEVRRFDSLYLFEVRKAEHQ